MPYFMIRADLWNTLSDRDAKRVQAASAVAIGEMPMVVDSRDGSEWYVANHQEATFHEHIEQLEEIVGSVQDARVLPSQPAWVQTDTDESAQRTDQPHRDVGLLLLQPITIEEHRGFEVALTELWRAIENQTLTTTAETQLRAMVNLLDETRSGTTPGKTERWKLIGPTTAVLSKMIKAGLDISNALEKLRDLGWSLPGL